MNTSLKIPTFKVHYSTEGNKNVLYCVDRFIFLYGTPYKEHNADVMTSYKRIPLGELSLKAKANHVTI